jgi:alkyl sulfatase BDS1-like metallo-beta-lactamase superfamily hydrolase
MEVLYAIRHFACPCPSRGGTCPAQDGRNDAADATTSANSALLDALPFDDTTDFDNANRGKLAPLPEQITGDDGNAVWDPSKYGFIAEGSDAPATVNPSLWRQSQLVSIGGLFEVVEGIYQIRNFDLSNMTIIEGNEGITVVDPLVSAVTAKAGLDLYYQNRGERAAQRRPHHDHCTARASRAGGQSVFRLPSPEGGRPEADPLGLARVALRGQTVE